MRIISFGTVLTAACLLAGCNGVYHKPAPHVMSGQALPVSVKVDPEEGASVRGDLHYRFNGDAYRSMPLKHRARELWAILPTQPLQPGDHVTYYIDVVQGDQHHALASPTSPYVVPVVSRLDLLLASIRTDVKHDHAHEPVHFHLDAEPGAVGSAILTYTVPGVPGEVTAAMPQSRPGRFRLTIPPAAVNPGLWTWRITMMVEGKPFHMPREDLGRFTIHAAPRPAKHHHDGHKHGGDEEK